MTLYALDTHGPTKVITSDGLSIPWRPVLDAATAFARLHPDHANRSLIHRGYWFVPCAECDGMGVWESLPPDEDPECVACRGTGYMPLSMIDPLTPDMPKKNDVPKSNNSGPAREG